MLQHRLSKNLKLTRVNITSQKDIEEIMDLCLVLCKLIVNRFDCYVTHFYRLVIYPIPSCFGSTYQHLWENIDKILLSLNDLFLANGIIFSLSSIKKITHNFDDFDFLFYANEPLDSYLLNLQLEFIDDSTEEEEIDGVIYNAIRVDISDPIVQASLEYEDQLIDEMLDSATYIHNLAKVISFELLTNIYFNLL